MSDVLNTWHPDVALILKNKNNITPPPLPKFPKTNTMVYHSTHPPTCFFFYNSTPSNFKGLLKYIILFNNLFVRIAPDVQHFTPFKIFVPPQCLCFSLITSCLEGLSPMRKDTLMLAIDAGFAT